MNVVATFGLWRGQELVLSPRESLVLKYLSGVWKRWSWLLEGLKVVGLGQLRCQIGSL